MEAVLLHNSDHIASVRGLVGMVLVVGHVLLDKLLVHGDFESRNLPPEILEGHWGDLDLGADRSHLVPSASCLCVTVQLNSHHHWKGKQCLWIFSKWYIPIGLGYNKIFIYTFSITSNVAP